MLLRLFMVPSRNASSSLRGDRHAMLIDPGKLQSVPKELAQI